MTDSEAQEDYGERADGTEHEPAADAEPQPATDDAEFAEPAAESATVEAAGDISHADEGTAQLRDIEPAEQAQARATATAAPEQAEPAVEAAAAEQAVAELGSQPAAEPAAEEPAAEPAPAAAEPALQPPAAQQAREPQPPAAPLQQQAPVPKPSSAAAKAAEAPAVLAAEPVATKPAAAAAGALASPRETAKDPQHGKPHKETAAERLTTPTAMRMLHSLEATQGGKTEFHIASGVVYKGKKLAADELSAMVDRLAVPKHAGDAALPPKPHAVKLVYEENKEQLVPVKEVTKEENIAFMAQLYTRCQETHAKTQQTLADKYLQPLVKPKASSAKK